MRRNITNQEKHLASIKKKQNQIESGKISDRFPQVSSISIEVKNFHGKEYPIVIIRTFKFLPDDYAYFNIECLRKRCIDGGFNLNRIIAKMISIHTGSKSGELYCHGNNLSRGHSYIYYDVNVKYKRNNKHFKAGRKK
jgi:hypothetical protein